MGEWLKQSRQGLGYAYEATFEDEACIEVKGNELRGDTRINAETERFFEPLAREP